MRNTIDAVADRDFVLDYLYACAALFVHLSRIGEELVPLDDVPSSASPRCRRMRRPGSSMMPQKLNPDVAELARGKAGTAIGRLTGLLATVKGLPLAYNRDLAEDKQATFRARRDVRLALGALAVLVEGLAFDRERLAAAAADPLLRATDAAEALVAEGVPFRDAHEQVAGQVRGGNLRRTRACTDCRDARSTSPLRSPPRRSAGRDRAACDVAARARPAAHRRPRRRPRPRRSSTSRSS